MSTIGTIHRYIGETRDCQTSLLKTIFANTFINSSFWISGDTHVRTCVYGRYAPEFDSDSTQLYCASLLRIISPVNQHAQKRLRINTIRNFPQAELDREINDRFLVNEHVPRALGSQILSVAEIFRFRRSAFVARLVSNSPSCQFSHFPPSQIWPRGSGSIMRR